MIKSHPVCLLSHLIHLTSFPFLSESRDCWVNRSNHGLTGNEVGFCDLWFLVLQIMPHSLRAAFVIIQLDMAQFQLLVQNDKVVTEWSWREAPKWPFWSPWHSWREPGQWHQSTLRERFRCYSQSSVLFPGPLPLHYPLLYFMCQSPNIRMYN